jgi:hypothetical protein
MKAQKIIIIFITILLLSGIFYWKISGLLVSHKDSNKYDNFAKCLTEKKVVMYTAGSCKYCRIQQKIFGGSFQYISNVDCVNEFDFCIEKGIQILPSWSINGEIYPGERALGEISNLSGCELNVTQ